jgi:hypothetical protein
MTEQALEQSAAQKEVAEAAKELSALRYRLKKVLADLPPPPGANSPTTDLDGEPDVATELRSTLDCVIADCLNPAIADLEAASLYRPARGRGKGGAA